MLWLWILPLQNNMANIQSSDFASALSEDVRTDENTSSFKSSCPCRQTSDAFDNTQKLTEHDEYRASEGEAFSLFPCPHPTCYGWINGTRNSHNIIRVLIREKNAP